LLQVHSHSRPPSLLPLQPRPPDPPHFPYTTLFRSPLPFAARHVGPNAEERAKMLAHLGFGSLDELTDAAVPASIATDRPLRLPPDRKSTRLNSSHVKISYAVFCLKKKKILIA